MSRVDSEQLWHSHSRTTLVVVAVIAMASAIACVSHHLTREVGTASASGGASELGVETPNLEGPDDLDLAPLVALSTAGLAFDHEPIPPTGLESRLRAYRANFAVLHPGEPAPREVLLACSPSVSSDKISSVLDTARRSGFDQARLVFESARSYPSNHTEAAPHRLSAARVSLSDEIGSEAQTSYIRPSEVRNCAELAELVIVLRQAGHTVTLAVRENHY